MYSHMHTQNRPEGVEGSHGTRAWERSKSL